MTPQLFVWAAALLLLLGIAALIVEIFILPGFGIAGITGIVFIVWGIILLAVDFSQATTALVWGLVLTVVFFFVALKLFKRLDIFQRLTLGTRQQSEAGYIAPQPELSLLIGKTGTALTTLRPSGAAEILGQRIDVITDGEFISAGMTIEVLRVEGVRVVVRSAGKN